MMCSIYLFPKIARPNRITSHSDTLIDNIFTNMLDSIIVSGLLLSGISDHLPVFVVFDANYRTVRDTDRSRYVRVRTEESINALKSDLISQNSEDVYIFSKGL